ncbi:MAG: penicillin-binding protein 2 [Actinomycetota bacterium]|nr:penicillin-binding protein 2 [Actinomycetota bacterium]
MTPQLAWRVAIIGGVTLIAFGLVFFRLWYLQVLSGDKYRAEATANQVRAIKVQAPRGEIVDREGRVVVGNRASLAVRVTPEKLPEDLAERRQLYERLGEVLAMRPERIERKVEPQLKAVPYAPATVKQDVDEKVVFYLMENLDDFPGVEPEQVFLRTYPQGQSAAHLVGYLGEVTEDQLEDERYNGVDLGDRIGQAGIESQYDRFLRGRNGASRLQVNAGGALVRPLKDERPEQGRQLRLSVDLDVQRVGQQALGGSLGAFAVMNVRNGQVLALGSSPSFDPNQFSKAIRQSDLDRLTDKDNGEPLNNRAIQGAYPTGSTFKLITAVAALEGGLVTPDEVVYDGGSLVVGDVTFENAGGVVNGALALRQALSVSSDVFFYKLGVEADGTTLIQDWAKKLGLGRPTGIDLPNDLPGVVPTPKYRNDGFAEFERCKKTEKPTPEEISFGKCGFLDRPWSVGDNVNLSVGQGDLAASPLQLAVAYAALANDGKVVQPRLGQRIEDSTGRTLQELEAPRARKLDIDATHRQAILDGLRAAASEPGGTSADVFAGFPIPIAGKTGTAEKGGGRADQSWYAALAPYPDPKYVVVTTFEAGGFGAETAAPAARAIIAELYGAEAGAAPAGSSQD